MRIDALYGGKRLALRLATILVASVILLCSACTTGPATSAIPAIPMASVPPVPKASRATEVEEPVRRRDLPEPVLLALPKGQAYDEQEFTYKRRQKAGVTTYDVYYEKGGSQFTINYDAQGKILEEQKRIRFSDVPREARTRIEKTLSAHYPGYKVLMVEELYRSGKTLLEIFFSHPESKTGLVEAIFEFETGALREFVNIRMKSISTFN
ncbi:MAG: hypothetical protein BGO99_07615 [Nitrosospira sp. 56-18]|jgi:hypothetical protein|nr:hypothetical protein [Nitrosospira sp.]OJY15430.1 MAG: hypothetical protein BGO99_07615 [Nitrosospira sp. 56-18]